MRFLLFLLFCPLVFSLGTIEDYIGKTREEDPNECFVDAINAAGIDHYSETKNLTNEELENAHEALKKCVSKVALVNPKVQKVEDQLAQKMYDWFKYTYVDLHGCTNKIKKNLNTDNCYLSTKKHKTGDDICNSAWGKDGCMIKVYNDHCGAGTAKKLSGFMLFKSRKQKECVAKYFKE